MKKNHKEKKFLAGRKRKDEEVDYTRMIHNIIKEMHGIICTSPKDVKENPAYNFKDLIISPSVDRPSTKDPDTHKFGIKPKKKTSQNSFNTNISEKDPLEIDIQNVIDPSKVCCFQDDKNMENNNQLNWAPPFNSQ